MEINCSTLAKFKFIRTDGYDRNNFIYFDKCGFKVAINKKTKELLHVSKIYYPEIEKAKEYLTPICSIEELKEKYNKHVDNTINKNTCIIKQIQDDIKHNHALREYEINRKKWWITQCENEIKEIQYTKFKRIPF